MPLILGLMQRFIVSQVALDSYGPVGFQLCMINAGNGGLCMDSAQGRYVPNLKGEETYQFPIPHPVH